MKKIINLLLFFLGLLNASAQINKTIPFYDLKMEIDGLLSESVWKKLPEHSNFYNSFPEDDGLADNQTEVRIFHNGKNLYISAIYYDSTSKTQISSLKRDVTIALSDAFIVVIDPMNEQQNGFYFAVNIGATQSDALIEPNDDRFRINSNWNAVWKANTSVSGNQKIYEIEIPLKIFGYNTENPTFGMLFYGRDIKANNWTSFKNIKRNFRAYDLRFSTPYTLENLTKIKTSKFTITPSVTINHQNNVDDNINESTFKPSLDGQYNLTPSLKLDATINPDFSQVDVDRQVTNLTRFAINFPEKRNFFLENSDLFSNLGVSGVNPFYSRKIGALNEIEFGLKLSGNITPNTRIGVLNVQTEKDNDDVKQNYGALVIQQKISNNFTTTGFLINRQGDDYNRVFGVNVNYKSTNKKWSSLANFSRSLSTENKKNSDFYNLGLWYTTRTSNLSASVKKVEKNYLADIGFVPRLYKYDAANNLRIREEFTEANISISLTKYPKNSKYIYSYRYLDVKNSTFFDDNKSVNQSSTVFNNALFFKDLSSFYINIYHDYIDLKYAFNPLRNGNLINPDKYNYVASLIGYNSVTNKKAYYNLAFRYGNYYNGKRTRYYARFGYHLLPFANLETSYEINKIDLNTLSNKTFHLARFTGEVFFNNRLNWTTYVQYNTQFDNFNINSRVQWEYKPLSYIYFVITDNFNKEIYRKNWGFAFKINYRFDL